MTKNQKINKIIEHLDNINNEIIDSKKLCEELNLDKTFITLTNFQKALKSGNATTFNNCVEEEDIQSSNMRLELKKICREHFQELVTIARRNGRNKDSFTWIWEGEHLSLIFVKDPGSSPEIMIDYKSRKDEDVYLSYFNSLASFIKYTKIL